jgi:hypothetical protein
MVIKMCYAINAARNHLESLLADAINLAKEDTTEGWKEIDKKLLPQILAYGYHNTIAKMAIDMYQHAQGSVRDLAATVTAKLRIDEVQENTFDELKAYTLRGLSDKHKYARFRATVATIKHGWYEQKHVSKMHENLSEIVEEGEDIGKLAKKYLSKLA